MKSRFLRFVCLFLLSIVLITACNGRTSVTSKSEPPLLTVAYSLWPGYFPLVIAQEKGFFTEQGVKVKLVYSENHQAPLADFSAGKYDGMAITLGSFMSSIEEISGSQIVLITDRSTGADAIVAQSNTQSVADLKGKRIGAKLGNFGELFVIKMLERNGLTPNDVTLVNLEAETIVENLKNGSIQAGQTWEPYVFQAVQSGAKVLFTSKQTPGLISDVVVFRSNVLRDRPDDVRAFIRAWFQAQDYWKTNPEESKTLVAKTLNIKPEEVSTEGIELQDLKNNLAALTPGSTTESLYYTAQLYADFYTRTGGLSTVPDIQKIIDPSFVQQLQ
ncbi:ABC transporter substrate-binding protein [Microcoleus sp. FACHB-672]|uniref:ABC transporter substrate-binding protein n=1 Tax=Microcoleus sp. FACHB-672 TaxID=2692825 RepID=UPI00168336AF|nr:ABC transporter substrate-binding protein [Microcoleus sp. FACHB-672]MBD2042849.1 ABC transporter substrate-binding protein [Microcoleus sp. FACHB-672]